MKKTKKQKASKSITGLHLRRRAVQNYAHKHPLLFFAFIFNIFIFSVFITIHFLNAELDMIAAKRVLFNQPDPVVQEKVEEMLEGYPMQSMAPYIARENKEVVAFLVGIAKKESAWGERTPKLNGEECYNYWGFRRKSERMGSGGHTCFDSEEEAVRIVAKRIERLVKKGYDTPSEMVLWKCGRCDGPEAAGAAKWIQDVNIYYTKMIEELKV